MPYKDPEKQKEAQRKHYLQNKNKFAKRREDRRKENKQVAHSLKTKCVTCGESDSVCLDFHHKRDKKDTVAHLIRESTVDQIYEEVEKCVVVCANCHNKIHRPLHITDGSDWNGFNPARVAKRSWFIDFLEIQECQRCGEADNRCLEFHHIKDKRFNISCLLTSGHSLSFLKEEIGRCEILCSNCHRKEHHFYAV